MALHTLQLASIRPYPLLLHWGHGKKSHGWWERRTREFPLSGRCCIPLLHPVEFINQPKALVSSEVYHVVPSHYEHSCPQCDHRAECCRRHVTAPRELLGGSLHWTSFLCYSINTMSHPWHVTSSPTLHFAGTAQSDYVSYDTTWKAAAPGCPQYAMLSSTPALSSLPVTAPSCAFMSSTGKKCYRQF